jgi:sensor histidine kinase YesM
MTYLNSISRLAVLEEAPKCQEAINDLIHILRYKQDTGDVTTTVEKELKVIDKMIDIYKIRNGNIFESIIHKRNQNERLYIPKNSILIFVENALEHAYIGLQKVWELKIIIECENEKCSILIKDNGIGFDVGEMTIHPGRFESMNRAMNEIKAIGDILVTSSKESGTSVKIIIFREKLM